MLDALLGRGPRTTRRRTPQVRTRSAVTTIQPAELYERLQNDDSLTVIDVRSANEYAGGHIAGARLLPLPNIRQRSNELPNDQPIVCVCRSGARSQAACEQLAAMGFENTLNLTGGMIGWQRAGLPTQ